MTMAIDPLISSLRIAGSGMQTQSTRLRIVSENIANAQSTGTAAGADPYARKTITFESELDRASGENLVQVKSVGVDTTPFRLEHMPGNPAADESGNVKMPNVDLLFEMADMREANSSYEANLQVVKQSRQMLSATIELMRT
jgi:flagellar basal-body rod protein FlgC